MRWLDGLMLVKDHVTGSNLLTLYLEATDQIQGKYDQGVQEYDEIHLHILKLADALSSGIIAQFPKKFSGK